MDELTSYKPSIYIDSKELPEIKDWKVGQTYNLVVKAKMVSSTQDQNNSISGRFEIQSMETEDKEDISEIQDNSEYSKAAAKIKQKIYG